MIHMPIGEAPRPKIHVRIISCDDPMMWYAEHVGETVPVDWIEQNGDYMVRQIAKHGEYPYRNIIKAKDGERV